MLYFLEQGPTEQTIIDQCFRHGLPLPEKIKNAPELGIGLTLYYMAFFDLNTCREQGFGEGPISWLAINQYADATGYEGEQREDLFYFIMKMDSAYLEYRAKKVKTT